MTATTHRMQDIHAEINQARISVRNLSYLVNKGNLSPEQLRDALDQLATLIQEARSAILENAVDTQAEKV